MLHTWEQIFDVFLDITGMKLESIILVKNRAHNNSSHALARSVEIQPSNRRITRDSYHSIAHRSEE